MWTWRFDPDEFVHVWRETGLDGPPYPVRVLETPATREQALELRRELATRLPARGDPDLSTALAILAGPQATVVVIGSAARSGSEIRMLGAVVRQRAVLVAQDPGATPDFGGHVRIMMGHAARLGQRVAARLPAVRAGREPWRTAPTRELRAVDPRHGPEDWDTDTALGKILVLLHRTRSGDGHVRVQTHLGRHYPDTATDFSWIDVAGDGRYLIKPGVELHVGPGAADTIATQIQRLLPRGW